MSPAFYLTELSRIDKYTNRLAAPAIAVLIPQKVLRPQSHYQVAIRPIRRNVPLDGIEPSIRSLEDFELLHKKGQMQGLLSSLPLQYPGQIDRARKF